MEGGIERMGGRKKGIENGPEILWVGGQRWWSPGGLLGGGDRKAPRRLEKYRRGKWRPQASAQPTVKKNWVVHVFPPTRSAVHCPGKLSQRRSTRFGLRDLGPTLALSLATVCSPWVRSLLRALLSAPWDAGDSTPLSTAMSLAGIPYRKAHSQRSIDILSCR